MFFSTKPVTTEHSLERISDWRSPFDTCSWDVSIAATVRTARTCRPTRQLLQKAETRGRQEATRRLLWFPRSIIEACYWTAIDWRMSSNSCWTLRLVAKRCIRRKFVAQVKTCWRSWHAAATACRRATVPLIWWKLYHRAVGRCIGTENCSLWTSRRPAATDVNCINPTSCVGPQITVITTERSSAV